MDPETSHGWRLPIVIVTYSVWSCGVSAADACHLHIESLSVCPQVKMFWRLLTLSLLATSCISASGHEWYKDISASDAITLKLDAQVGPVSRVEKVTKDSVEVQWELGSNRNRPRIQGYELQYLILAQVNAL